MWAAFSPHLLCCWRCCVEHEPDVVDQADGDAVVLAVLGLEAISDDLEDEHNDPVLLDEVYVRLDLDIVRGGQGMVNTRL